MVGPFGEGSISGEAGFSLQKAAQVRLDNLGLVKNHSCFINNPNRIELLEQRLELQRSIGRSEEIRKSSALEKDSPSENPYFRRQRKLVYL